MAKMILNLAVEFDADFTNAVRLARAFKQALTTALSTPGFRADYGPVALGPLRPAGTARADEESSDDSACDVCDDKGWDHYESSYGPEIECCDSCGKYPDDDAAIAAHRKECGCDWPERAPRPGEEGFDEPAEDEAPVEVCARCAVPIVFRYTTPVPSDDRGFCSWVCAKAAAGERGKEGEPGELGAPADQPAAPAAAALAGVVDRIRAILWHDGPDTEWSADTPAEIADVLEGVGLGPDRTVEPGTPIG